VETRVLGPHVWPASSKSETVAVGHRVRTSIQRFCVECGQIRDLFAAQRLPTVRPSPLGHASHAESRRAQWVSAFAEFDAPVPPVSAAPCLDLGCRVQWTPTSPSPASHRSRVAESFAPDHLATRLRELVAAVVVEVVATELS